MSTPTLRELCAGATKGPWHMIPIQPGDKYIEIQGPGVTVDYDDVDHDEQRANAALIARLSPEVALAVYKALNHMRHEMLDAAERTGVGKLCEHTESWRMINNALRLLDGQPTVHTSSGTIMSGDGQFDA